MSLKPEDPYAITTIERHILEEQHHFPEATGVLTQLLYDIALAGKVISSRTNRAGLAEILGERAHKVWNGKLRTQPLRA